METPEHPQDPLRESHPQPSRPEHDENLVTRVTLAIVAIVVLCVILFIIFVPRMIAREVYTEARYELVSDGYSVNDEWECIDWGFIWCSEYGWVRNVSAHATVRAIEMEGQYVVTAEVISGLYLQGSSQSLSFYISEDDVHTFNLYFPTFEVTEEEHYNSASYEVEITVSAPKTIEIRYVTIFESWF